MPTIDTSPITTAIVAGVTTGHVGHSIELNREWDADLYRNTVNVMSEEYGAIDGGSAATNTAAINSAVSDIAATGKLGAVLIPLGVDLPVTADGPTGASKVSFIGGGTLSTTDTATEADPGHLITYPAGATDWGVYGLRFVAPDNTIVAIKATSAREFAVEDCRTTGCTLIRTNADIATYGTIDTDETTGNVCRGFSVRNNVLTLAAADDVTNLAAVLLLYCFDGVIAGNRITGHHQGIQWWGGNANPAADGDAANERKCGRLNIADNIVIASGEGGIWGSMGDKITVTGNTVDGAGDLCIDLEGCTHSTVTGNTVNDGQNGGLATFYICTDILFKGNTVTTSVLNGRLARVQNGSGIPEVSGVRFDSNTFTCLNNIGYVQIETAFDSEFSNNTLTNCSITTRTNNQLFTTVENNTFLFTEIASVAFSAVLVGDNNGGGRLRVKDNTVTTTVNQPAGSKAIDNDQFDSSSPPVVIIEGNEVVGSGWPSSIVTRWAGPTAGVAHTLLRNNMVPVGKPIVITEAGGFTSVTLKVGNLYDDLTAA